MDLQPPFLSAYARPQSASATLKGSIGGTEVEMTYTNQGPAFTGELHFLATATRRRFTGKVSYEGIFKAKAILPGDQDSSMPALPSTFKGVFLTQNRLVGSWKGALTNEAEFLNLGGVDPNWFMVEQAQNDGDGIELSHWTRQVDCIAQSGAATGVIEVEIPELAVKTMDYNWKMVYWTLVKSLLYQPGCTCQALEKRGGGTLRRWVEAPTLSESVLTVTLVETLAGAASQRKTLNLDLETGTLLP